MANAPDVGLGRNEADIRKEIAVIERA